MSGPAANGSAADGPAADGSHVTRPTGLWSGRWLLFAVLLLAVPVVAMVRHTDPPPDLGQTPEFSLVDQRGRPLGSADLLGGITVVDFIFTRCGNICPRLTAQMSALDGRLPPAVSGVPVRLVSITIDPDHDTAPVLAAYADDHGARLDRWSFVSGAPDDVRRAVEGFQQAAEPQDTDGDGIPDDFTHSLRFLVLDTRGHIRAMSPADDAGLDTIADLVDWLARHPEG